jgi:hypothetical protein
VQRVEAHERVEVDLDPAIAAVPPDRVQMIDDEAKLEHGVLF